MQAAGHDIEAHTRTHPDLTTLTQQQALDEIGGSMSDLKAIGINPVSIAFPYGAYNSSILALVSSSGFSMSRTAMDADGGINYLNANKLLIKTHSVENTVSVDTMKTWIDKAVSTNGWLVLVFHQVGNNLGQYSITPANFQAVVDYLKANNIKVVTAKEALTYLP
jgi:peptidoglycan/xylan/chitin deacetylase (PgdA/CDA1 family)